MISIDDQATCPAKGARPDCTQQPDFAEIHLPWAQLLRCGGGAAQVRCGVVSGTARL